MLMQRHVMRLANNAMPSDAMQCAGEGLRALPDGRICAVHAGWLQSDRTNAHWVESSRKRVSRLFVEVFGCYSIGLVAFY